MTPRLPLAQSSRRLGFCRLALLIALLWTAASSADSGYHTMDLWLESRGIQIPATWVLPDPLTAPVPWVIMAHGHGGSRDEAGGFRRLAEALALRGIASIRMDFAGCGDSHESLLENNLNSMLADWRAARDFAAAQTEVLSDSMGLLGYSMGARVSLLATEDYPAVRAMVLWAPIARDGASDMFAFFDGEAAFVQYREVAEQSGTVDITTPWNTPQQLSLQWFQQLEDSRPETSLAAFHGALLVLHGSEDEIVPPTVSLELLARTGRPADELLVLPGASHGLGFYDASEPVAREVLEATVEFFSRILGSE